MRLLIKLCPADICSSWTLYNSPVLKTLAKELVVDSRSMWELKSAWTLSDLAALSLDEGMIKCLAAAKEVFVPATLWQQSLVRLAAF